MIKSVIKEIFIILLLSIAILLILGILFYEYIPINRIIPEREAYVTPNEVKEEIDETITETEKVEVTYEVTDSDLNIYQQSGSYIEGKANPFAAISEDVDGEITGNDSTDITGTPIDETTGSGNSGGGSLFEDGSSK